jgi:hypothetical protein
LKISKNVYIGGKIREWELFILKINLPVSDAPTETGITLDQCSDWPTITINGEHFYFEVHSKKTQPVLMKEKFTKLI